MRRNAVKRSSCRLHMLPHTITNGADDQTSTINTRFVLQNCQHHAWLVQLLDMNPSPAICGSCHAKGTTAAHLWRFAAARLVPCCSLRSGSM
jgi:hypothetical protein